MHRQQLISLFLSSLVTWMVFSGLIGLLPVYTVRLGADSAVAGYLLGILFLAWGLGATAAGWLSDRISNRKPIYLTCNLAMIPLFWLSSQANDLWSLSVIAFVIWSMAGAAFSMVNVLTGLFADDSQRGQTFGLIALSSGLGILLGGLYSGPVMDEWGFPTLLALSGVIWIVQPIIGYSFDEHEAPDAPEIPAVPTPLPHTITAPFKMFLLASVMAFVALHVIGLAQPLAMDELEFSATAISSAVAASGLVTLPLPLIMGWLSDRIGRKPPLVAAYICGAVGLVLLSASTALWHFWIVAALRATMMATSSVGRALVMDLVPEESLGLGLSLFGITVSVASVLSLSVAGAAIDRFGMTPALTTAAIFPLAAVILLTLVQNRAPQPIEAPVPGR